MTIKYPTFIEFVEDDNSRANERQIKRKLEDDGYRVSDLARHLHKDFPTVTERSADAMLRRLIAGQAWYPTYAAWLQENYGVIVAKPKWAKGVRERMKLAA